MPIVESKAAKGYFLFLAIMLIPMIWAMSVSGSLSMCITRAGKNCSVIQECVHDNSTGDVMPFIIGIIYIINTLIIGTLILTVEIYRCRGQNMPNPARENFIASS
jgi:hypothetical protein